MRAAAGVLLLACAAAACGGARGVASGGPVLLVAHGGVLVSLACPGAGGGACASRVRGAMRPSRCDGGRAGLDAGGLPDGAVVTPPGPAAPPMAGDTAATAEERDKIAAQLAKTDPTSAAVPVDVRGVLRDDLDGDGRPDAAFAVRRGVLDALLVASSANPIRLRILQFSDGEPIELLGAADVDPARGGRELIIRVSHGETVSYEALRDTGELVGQARCLTGR